MHLSTPEFALDLMTRSVMPQVYKAKVMSVSHIGITVSSLPEAVRFFEQLLERKPRTVREYSAPYIATVTNIPDATLDVAYFDLPGGVSLELTEYRELDRAGVHDTATPGIAHLSLVVVGIEELWKKAVASGAQPVSSMVVEITSGPNQGGRMVYLRIHGDVFI